MPGLGRNLFSVKQAASNGFVSIFDTTTQGWRRTTSPFHFKSLGATSSLAGSHRQEWRSGASNAGYGQSHAMASSTGAFQSQEPEHRQKSGKQWGGLRRCTVPYCDVCAEGNSHQLALPKTANHKVNHSFQLVFVDLMGTMTPGALGDCKYVRNISHEHTK